MRAPGNKDKTPATKYPFPVTAASIMAGNAGDIIKSGTQASLHSQRRCAGTFVPKTVYVPVPVRRASTPRSPVMAMVRSQGCRHTQHTWGTLTEVVDVSRTCIFLSLELDLWIAENHTPCRMNYQPKIYANINGATIEASDSTMYFGVDASSLPHVIFSLGTAPEYDP